jgi:hypothetical protein
MLQNKFHSPLIPSIFCTKKIISLLPILRITNIIVFLSSQYIRTAQKQNKYASRNVLSGQGQKTLK